MALPNKNSKADIIAKQAQKKQNKFDWFGINTQINQEESAELFSKAASQYKVTKQYKSAGLCHANAAKCFMKANEEVEAAISWIQSGKCYSHCDTSQAIESFRNAIEIKINTDKFNQVAKLEEKIGDIHCENKEFDDAIKAYETCAEYFMMEDDESNANRRLLKVAHLCGKKDIKQWHKAIKIFEKTVMKSNDSNLKKWNVTEYLFKASLLRICALTDKSQSSNVDWNKEKMFNERYCDLSDIYAKSKQCKFIFEILESLPVNMALYQDAVIGFSKFVNIDMWTSDLIKLIETYIEIEMHKAPDLQSVNVLNDDDDNKDSNHTSNAHDPFQNQISNEKELLDAPDLDQF